MGVVPNISKPPKFFQWGIGGQQNFTLEGVREWQLAEKNTCICSRTFIIHMASNNTFF